MLSTGQPLNHDESTVLENYFYGSSLPLSIVVSHPWKSRAGRLKYPSVVFLPSSSHSFYSRSPPSHYSECGVQFSKQNAADHHANEQCELWALPLNESNSDFSVQFIELKNSVFKKFDRNNLFQLSCSDCRERFHYVILLFVVCVRNLDQFNWDMSQFWPLIDFIVVVFVVELFVDWVKHGFILKFNELSSEVYREYTLSLAHDMVKTKQDIVSSRCLTRLIPMTRPAF